MYFHHSQYIVYYFTTQVYARQIVIFLDLYQTFDEKRLQLKCLHRFVGPQIYLISLSEDCYKKHLT